MSVSSQKQFFITSRLQKISTLLTQRVQKLSHHEKWKNSSYTYVIHTHKQTTPFPHPHRIIVREGIYNSVADK